MHIKTVETDIQFKHEKPINTHRLLYFLHKLS